MRRHLSGFTLIEVLLSVALLGMVLAAAHAVLASTASARERIEAASGVAASAQSLAWLMQEDLRGMAVGSASGAGFSGAARSPSAGGEVFSFVTASNPLLQDAATPLFAVAYGVRRNAQDAGAFDLYRSQTPWGQAARQWEPVFRGLRAMRVDYSNGVVWLPVWAAEKKELPLAVRVAFQFGAGGEDANESCTLVVRPPAAVPPERGGGS